MKMVIDRKLFIKALKDVKKENVKKSVNLAPVVHNTVKIIAGLDNIHLSEYGEHSELTKIINDSKRFIVKSLGGVVIKIKLLLKILPKLLGDKITIETDKDNHVVIKSGDTVVNIKAMSISDAPDDIKNNKKVSAKVDGKDFKKALKSNLKNVSDREYRPILTGVNFNLNDKGLRLVSTDSHRLARNDIKTLNNHGNFNITVPGHDLYTFYKLIDTKKPITINFGDQSHAGVCGLVQDNLRMNISGLLGDYPDTSQLIPNNYNINFNINRLKLLKAVRQVSILSHESYNNIIKLYINGDNMQVSSQSPDMGTIKTKLTPASKIIRSDGHYGNYNQNLDEFAISFNPDYVKDALSGLTRVKDVSIGLLSPLRPFTIRPVNDSTNVQLITPVRTF